jgi:RNA polymerase sigma factor (TIGR02999 family)
LTTNGARLLADPSFAFFERLGRQSCLEHSVAQICGEALDRTSLTFSATRLGAKVRAMSDVTRSREAVQGGPSQAAQELLPLVYDELRRLAARKFAGERPGQTLQATALVHEAWLRLGGDPQQEWKNRAHFFAAAAEAMRRILIDKARRKRAARHGAEAERVPLDGIDLAAAMDDDQLLDLHDALDRLASHDPGKAELVKLRFFAGLTLGEAAQVLGCSEVTAKRHWAYARAWLFREIHPAHPVNPFEEAS